MQVYINNAHVTQLSEAGKDNVVADRLRKQQTLRLAVLGDKRNAARDRVRRRVDIDLFAKERDRAGFLSLHRAEDRHRHLRPPCAHQSGDAQDLAPTEVKGDIFQNLLPLSVRQA